MAEPFIDIAAEPRSVLPIRLVGVEYSIVPPKNAFTLELASRTTDDDLRTAKATHDLIYSWIDQAFRDDAPKVRERLADPLDDLDLDHIMLLIQRVVEAQSGNPTT